MTTLLIVIVCLVAAILLVLLIGLLWFVRRLNHTLYEVESTLTAVRQDILPLAADIRRVVFNTGEVVDNVKGHMDVVHRVLSLVENLVVGGPITKVTTSGAVVLSVLKGLSQSIKALKSGRKQLKEVSNNE